MVNRKRIYEVLANEGDGDRVAIAYNLVMVILVVSGLTLIWPLPVTRMVFISLIINLLSAARPRRCFTGAL